MLPLVIQQCRCVSPACLCSWYDDRHGSCAAYCGKQDVLCRCNGATVFLPFSLHQLFVDAL